MEIILTQDVPKLGYKGDTVKVRPGYARNYLIPQAMGVIATKVNAKIMEENQRQAAHKIAKVKQEAEELAAKLNDTTIEMVAKTGTSGKIFGSITTLQVAQSLKEKGFDIDRRKISLNEEIKNVGSYQATLDLHKNVKATINLVIVPENVA
jgi:large subunit ribosomal protein L9